MLVFLYKWSRNVQDLVHLPKKLFFCDFIDEKMVKIFMPVSLCFVYYIQSNSFVYGGIKRAMCNVNYVLFCCDLRALNYCCELKRHTWLIFGF